MKLGLFDVFKKNKEMDFLFDLDLFEEKSKKVHLKRLALETCINFLGRTISQSEFRVKDGNKYIKDDLYYRLNVRPNKNMTSSMFWQTAIHKLVHDNHCLIIQADDQDLLIADSFDKVEYAVYEDQFKHVVVKGHEFLRTFSASDVFYLEYNNKALMPLIDELFIDYGDVFGRLISAQLRKSQIRGTVKVDAKMGVTKEKRGQLQEFINKLYKAYNEKDVAVVPEQNGFEYKEHSKETTGTGQSVDEINKLTDGFLDKVAMALGIPIGVLHGNIADVERQTKNYKVFTVGPLVKKIKDEGNAKFLTKKEYLDGKQLDVRQVFYKDIFELATSIDKLRSSGVMNGHEIRDEIGLGQVDNPLLDEYVITKNYGKLDDEKEKSDSGEGGDDE